MCPVSFFLKRWHANFKFFPSARESSVTPLKTQRHTSRYTALGSIPYSTGCGEPYRNGA